jgi:hypothetical protein
MGSYCSLDFDDVQVFSVKSVVPDEFIALFQETDRADFPGDEDTGELSRHLYAATRTAVLDRLDVSGITSSAAKTAFQQWQQSETDSWREMLRDDPTFGLTLKAIEEFTYEEWQRRVPNILHTRFDRDQPEATDEVEERMLDASDGWLFFKATDYRLLVRAMLDAFPESNEVKLDISDLIHGGYLDEESKLCEAARASDAQIRPVNEPIVLLGEGSTDVRALQKSICVLYPHLVDYFSFFDHMELNVDGGASYLVKFLRAFAAARISSRMVAIFDNDTAGREAFEAANELRLPRTIKVLRLPDTGLASAYPTIGPQGNNVMNVNGTAASIELYLGRHNLTDYDGSLIPVRWRGLSQRTNTYQGQVDRKAEIMERFNRDIGVQRTASEAQALFPELVQVWETVFSALET